MPAEGARTRHLRVREIVNVASTSIGKERHSESQSSQGPLTQLRELTPDGILQAQAFVEGLRGKPLVQPEVPPRLIDGDRHLSRPFRSDGDVKVEPRTFHTRREAGEYFAQVLAPIRHRIVDDAGVWSWLGMYYFKNMVAPLVGKRFQTIPQAFAFTQQRGDGEVQRRYRHWLLSSWRLYEQHPHARYLLDQPITSFGYIPNRTFPNTRVFNSVGVITLVLRLYTTDQSVKRGFAEETGGLAHLLRILPQLELTHDVYGMEASALLALLPEPFHAWGRAGPRGPTANG